jgi:hypothetical protein
LPEECGASPCTVSGCRKNCTTQSECGAGSYCKLSGGTGTCTAKLPGGTAATQPFECLSNVIADGVCCDRTCTGCEACSGAPLTAAAKGVCASVLAGRAAPSGACTASDDPCGLDGTCDGTGSCAYRSAACDDDDGCTQDDVCREGQCRGAPRLCQSPPPCRLATTCSDGVCEYTELVPDGQIDSKCPVTAGRCFQGGCVRCTADEHCTTVTVCDPATHTCVAVE